MKTAHQMRAGKFFRFVQDLGDDFDAVLNVSGKDSACREGGNPGETLMWTSKVRDLACLVRISEKLVKGDPLEVEFHNPRATYSEVLFQRRVKKFQELRRENML